MLKSLVLTTLLTVGLITAPLYAQDSVKIEAARLTDNIYMITGKGGNIGLLAGVERILALTDDDSKIIPGHGPLASRADLQRYRDMLVAANERLLGLKKQGMVADDAVPVAPLKDMEVQCGGGFFSSGK